MCILCDAANLRMLVSPLRDLSHLDLSESIHIAREAAIQLVLDTTDALGEIEDSESLLRNLAPEVYLEYVVERAEQDGVARDPEVREWKAAVSDHSILLDPRVQAFLSSAAEGLASYALQLQDHRSVLERYLEVPAGAPVFGGIGPNGEIAFDLGSERYVVLTDDEALRIVMDRLIDDLWREDPARLLAYTNLPAGAVDILAAAQQRPQEEANDVLAGMVDVQALSEDTLRQSGCARFLAEGISDDFTEQRFGDRLIIRLLMSGQPEDDD
jgi:hypothetical protein